jgi:hypothetical protein
MTPLADGPTPSRRRQAEPDTAGFTVAAPATGAPQLLAPQTAAPGPYPPGPPSPGPYEPPSPGPYDEDDSDLFEREWDRPRATNRLTVLLGAGLVGVLGFMGGVAAQKHHDAGLTASSAAAVSALRNRAVGGGFGGTGGGFGGTGGGFGGTGSGFGGTGSGASPGAGSGAGSGAEAGAAGSGAGSSSGLPVVVGTVKSMSGTTLVVTNFAGKAVTVHVPPTATVTTPGLGGLKVGATVSVSGTRQADGSVTATAVINRRTGG